MNFTLVAWSKGHAALGMGACHCKSASSLDLCQWVFCSWRRNIFNLSRGPTGHFIKGSCKFMRESSSWCVITMISLVTIIIVIVEICFEVVRWPLLNTCLKSYANLWVEVSHSQLPLCHIWWRLFMCTQRYKLFNRPRHLAKQGDWEIN